MFVGALWGCTNPLLKQGSGSAAYQRTSDSFGQYVYEFYCTLTNWKVSTPMHVSLGGELINALFVDDQTDGLNSLIVLTRVSATSVALLYVDVNEEEVIITRHHTHTLPLTWTDASVVAEIMDGPHVWLAYFSNVHGAILNDFACDGGDQVLLVSHKPEDERRWVLTDVMSTVVQASAANGGGITQHRTIRSKKSRRKTAHADDNSIQVLVNKLAAPAQADKSVVPESVQHSPSNSTLHLVVTVRNASTTLLENVSVLLAGSNSELVTTTTTTTGGSDVLALLGPHARHAFKCHVALAPGLHRRPHVDLHVLGTWGGQPDCLLFDGGRVRVDIADILTLPSVRAPHLGIRHLGLTINAIKAGMAAVTVSAPNAGMLECQLRQVHSELTPHDIFALENPLDPTHIQLIQAVLSAMQTELAFESTAQPTPDGRASVQLALDRAMGDLHLAMKRRSDRMQRG
ncbi:hypothetical protein DYB34_001251 [Aphanomyces astaci]|uniref:Uncharacterized protein n=2 Tax=Aphanomyces astaci TaxID=112090 RepID=A0A418C521_APHAT|nr:hypothetical protein DYB34_001251 [Aphanomyces astaci]